MAIDDQVDLMTEEEMDLETDPEFQDILKQLGAGEAQALMQLIKEYKEMVAQGFQGEFEDFIKVKMATAQGDDDVEFQSEDEMIIEPDEMMDIEKQIVPTEMAAEGGRIKKGMGGAIEHLRYYGMNDNDIIEIYQKWKDSGTTNSFHQYVLDTVNPPENYAEGGSIGRKPRPRGNPPVFEKIEDMREWRIANPDVEDVADYKSYYEKKRKKKQEGGIMDVVEDEEMVETTPGQSRQEMIMQYLRDRGLPITPENIQRAIIEMITGGMPYTEEASYDMPQMDQPSVLPRGMMVDETIIDSTPSGIATLTEDVMTPPAKPFIYDAPIDQGPWNEERALVAQGGRIGAYDGYKPGDFEKFNKMKQDPDIKDPTEGLDLELLQKLLDSGMDETEAYRKAGGTRFAAGGRVPYGLGSLVKKVFKPIKKVGSKLVKSVKKFAKSDLGKAALMYMATAGAANIGAAGGLKGASWSGGQWLKPTNVLSNIQGSWGNLRNMFSGAEKLKDSGNLLKKIGIDEKHLLRTGKERFLYGPPSQKQGILKSMGEWAMKNPMITIPAIMAGTAAYTQANPGEENLDRVMADRNREVADWDNIMTNIRSGQTVTPFTTGNVMFPYPNYYLNVADGGRVARAEGGIMDLGGMEKDYRETGGFVPIGEYEKKDDVPARLSLNEFVMTADAVRGAGNGDVDKGAEVMEDMMETLEEQGRRHRQAQDMFSVSERLSEVVN